MTDNIVTRLRACWCSDAFSDRGLVDPACDHDGVRAEAADEIDRLRLACHFLAGWLSYHDQEIDTKKAVKIAYKKAVKHERHSATPS